MAAPRKKTAAKTTAAKEVKAMEPAAEVEEKAEAAGSQAEAKAPAKKTAARKTAAPKKEAAKKAEPKKEAKSRVFVQYLGKEISTDALAAEAKKAFVAAGHKEEEIETIDIYVKPEENAAYYAVNGIGSEAYRIQL